MQERQRRAASPPQTAVMLRLDRSIDASPGAVRGEEMGPPVEPEGDGGKQCMASPTAVMLRLDRSIHGFAGKASGAV